jgi:phosphoglycolate phosphatase-like HAD superfamily hydrolase
MNFMISAKPHLQAIFFDVDGVLVDSMGIKGDCFVTAFENLTPDPEIIRSFHYKNGGLNRKKKIEQMLIKVLNMDPDSRLVAEIQEHFSRCLESRMPQVALMPGVLDSLGYWQNKVPMFAVSAMPTSELRELMRFKGLSKFFDDIQGYPPAKEGLIRAILAKNAFDPNRCVLVGDSEADAVAAQETSCRFVQMISRNELSANQKMSVVTAGISKENFITDLNELVGCLSTFFHFDLSGVS